MTIIPNKSAYSVGEFWSELTQSSLWKNFAKAKANADEVEMLEAYVDLKISQKAGRSPLLSVFKTHVGKAIYMALMSLPAQPRDR